ncbi:MAG: hypothetical protein N2319_03745 [Candidatus Kapabacteria bacterium]|nr:hypothetical protein [Candidatus Kapabacteria bacterium]
MRPVIYSKSLSPYFFKLTVLSLDRTDNDNLCGFNFGLYFKELPNSTDADPKAFEFEFESILICNLFIFI